LLDEPAFHQTRLLLDHGPDLTPLELEDPFLLDGVISCCIAARKVASPSALAKEHGSLSAPIREWQTAEDVVHGAVA
jgi:hypothetical protein